MVSALIVATDLGDNDSKRLACACTTLLSSGIAPIAIGHTSPATVLRSNFRSRMASVFSGSCVSMPSALHAWHMRPKSTSWSQLCLRVTHWTPLCPCKTVSWSFGGSASIPAAPTALGLFASLFAAASISDHCCCSSSGCWLVPRCGLCPEIAASAICPFISGSCCHRRLTEGGAAMMLEHTTSGDRVVRSADRAQT